MSNDRLIRLPEVIERVGLGRSKIYEMIKEQEFPAPRKSGRASLWRLSEVDAWIGSLESA